MKYFTRMYDNDVYVKGVKLYNFRSRDEYYNMLNTQSQEYFTLSCVILYIY